MALNFQEPVLGTSGTILLYPVVRLAVPQELPILTTIVVL